MSQSEKGFADSHRSISPVGLFANLTSGVDIVSADVKSCLRLAHDQVRKIKMNRNRTVQKLYTIKSQYFYLFQKSMICKQNAILQQYI
jgi:hypothetical protein